MTSKRYEALVLLLARLSVCFLLVFLALVSWGVV